MNAEAEKQEEDTEEVVLSRWQKLKQWWEMINATYKAVRWTMMALKMTALGTTAAVVVDEVVETTFVEDGATALGLREEAPKPEIAGEYVSAEEFKSFIEWQRTHEHEHTHDFALADHSHELPPHEHPDKPHTHADHIHADHSHPEIMREIANKEVSGGSSVIINGTLDDAFKRHVEEDH